MAPGNQFKPGVQSELNEFLHHQFLAAGNQRPHVSGLTGRISDFDILGQHSYSGQNLVVYALLQQQPGGSATRLSGIAEHAEHGGPGRPFYVRIIEDHVRGLAAQLQADPLNVLGCLSGDGFTRAGLAGK